MGAAVSAFAGGAKAGATDHAVGREHRDLTVALDLFPLTSPVATQFVLDRENTQLTFRYRPADLSITELRRQDLGPDLVGSLLVEVESVLGATDQGGSERGRPVEDDRFRLSGCLCSGRCRSIAGPISTASPRVRQIIESLTQLAASAAPIPVHGSYLRCTPVDQRRWSRLESRGAYELYDMADLGETAARAVSRAVDKPYTFVPLSAEEDDTITDRITLDQIFVSGDRGRHSCERFTVVAD